MAFRQRGGDGDEQAEQADDHAQPFLTGNAPPQPDAGEDGDQKRVERDEQVEDARRDLQQRQPAQAEVNGAVGEGEDGDVLPIAAPGQRAAAPDDVIQREHDEGGEEKPRDQNRQRGRTFEADLRGNRAGCPEERKHQANQRIHNEMSFDG